MSYPFTEIIIIYNPVSTGDSAANAKKLKAQLEKNLSVVDFKLMATEYAGHAEKIGKDYAKSSGVLLVSSSGDGGYNELINGVMSVKNHKVAVCVLPSGNANDHARALESDDITKSIISGKTRRIDLLKVIGVVKGSKWSRYAHSYAGVGITAYIGRQLTKANLNPINEKWLVIKYLMSFRRVSLKVTSWGHKRFHGYDSLVVANIDRMSKVIRLDEAASVTDGKFEVYSIRTKSFLALMLALLSTAFISKSVSRRGKSISFIPKKGLAVQCDGEVFSLDKGENVTVEINSKVLTVVL